MKKLFHTLSLLIAIGALGTLSGCELYFGGHGGSGGWQRLLELLRFRRVLLLPGRQLHVGERDLPCRPRLGLGSRIGLRVHDEHGLRGRLLLRERHV